MENLYTEEQFKEYSNLCEKMANNDDIFEGLNIHFEIKEWELKNNISKEAEIQMNEILKLDEDFHDIRAIDPKGH